MTALLPAFLLGLLGSLHCAGMCGPLTLALPPVGASRLSYFAGRMLYNVGRLSTYAVLGLFAGLIGQSLTLAGVQRWVSIGLGALLLLIAALSQSKRFNVPVPFVSRLKSALGPLLRRRTFTSLFLFGSLNGLLPCGLVYVACAGAVTSHSAASGVLFMFAFGLGTLPMMLALSLPTRALQAAINPRLRRFVPVAVALLGAALILRGLDLGIPYLSPALATSCH